MYLYPLQFHDLELASTYNQQSLRGATHKSNEIKQGGTNTAMPSSNSLLNDPPSRVRKRGQGYQNNYMEGGRDISMSTSMTIDENSATIDSSSTEMRNNPQQQEKKQLHEDNHSVEYIHSGAVPYLIFSKSNISISSDFSKEFVKSVNVNKKDCDNKKATGRSHSASFASANSASTSDAQSPNSAPDNDKLHFRTGRWANAETSYVDLLIHLFDSRQLSSCLPGGIKLNEFLRDLVLCKSSRLTKKYKNAKLSARSFRALVLDRDPHLVQTQGLVGNYYTTLSESQQQFLESIRSNVTRLIVKFNMTKMWRIHLSNLCLQIGYQGLYTTDWVKSLDEMEKKVNAQELNVRRARRKRMEAALRHDITGSDKSSVVVSHSNVNSTGESPGKGITSPLASANVKVITFPTMPATNTTEVKSSVDTVKAIVKRNRSNSGIYFGIPPNPKSNFKRSSSLVNLNSKIPNEPTPSKVTSELVAKVSNASIASSVNQTDVNGNMNTLYNEADAIPVLPLPKDLIPVQQIYNSSPEQALAQISPTTCPQNENDNSQDSNDDDFSIGFLDLDDFVGNAYPYMNDKSDDDDSCHTVKNPFMSKIMAFIHNEDLPFHYVDVWVPCTQSSDESVCLSTASSDDVAASNEPVRLIHAGDSKRCDLEKIREMQLNEFGGYSKNYSFDSGAGMPGKVYLTNCWSWLQGIPDASPTTFERVGGARMCGIRTAVGIPVKSSKIGRIVVGLYSFMDLREDPAMISKLYDEFHNFDPQPKWKLYIDMKSPIPAPVPTSVQALSTVSANESFDNVGSTQSISSNTSDLTSIVSHVKREEGLTACEASMIANILAEHIPLEGNNSNVPLSSFISLRLLLLRYPNGCSAEEKRLLFILKMSYDGYARIQKTKREIAELLVTDWIHLSNQNACAANPAPVSSPWGTPMTFVDYATATTPLVGASPSSSSQSNANTLMKPSIMPMTTTSFSLPAQTMDISNSSHSTALTMTSFKGKGLEMSSILGNRNSS